jgi:hypothetical protein
VGSYSDPAASGNPGIARVPSSDSDLKPLAMSRDAVARWLLIAIIGAVDWIWMARAGFHVGAGFLQSLGVICALSLIGLFYCLTNRDDRIMRFAHFAAQYLSLFAVMMPLSYLAVSTDAPLVDPVFDAMDKAMGLDWIAWKAWVVAHPVFQCGLRVAYDSLPVQTLIAYIYNVHTRGSWRNNQIWWITYFSALVTIGVSALFPAVNPHVYYGLAGADDFLHMQHLLGLRAGTMHAISFIGAQGLVQLPSFHTILAIMLIYNFRHNRWLLIAALLLNTALILSCPTEGSHYFVDLLAGAVVVVATILGIRAFERQFARRSLAVITAAAR